MQNLNRDKYINSYIKKLNINCKIISFLTGATILLSGIGLIASNINKKNNPFNNNTLIYGFDNSDNLNAQKKADVLLSAVYRNKNINDEVRKVFLDFVPFFYDNECQNYELTYNNLKNFNLVYSNKNGDVVAQYCNNTITIFDSTNKIALKHEIFHLIADTGNNLNIGVNEGMAQLLTQEYFDYQGEEYEKTELITKILIEITSSDTLINTFLNGNKDILINKLKNIYGDEENAMKLLNLMDEITYLEQQNSKDNLDLKVTEFIDMLSNYTEGLSEEKSVIINSYINTLNNFEESCNKIYFCENKKNDLIYIERKIATNINGISILVQKDNYKNLFENFEIYSDKLYLNKEKSK